MVHESPHGSYFRLFHCCISIVPAHRPTSDPMVDPMVDPNAKTDRPCHNLLYQQLLSLGFLFAVSRLPLILVGPLRLEPSKASSAVSLRT